MKEGGLDAVFFAVFVGQAERSPDGRGNGGSKTRLVCDGEGFPSQITGSFRPG